MDYIEDRTGRLLCITILVYIIVIGPTLSKDSNPTGHRKGIRTRTDHKTVENNKKNFITDTNVLTVSCRM